MARFVLAAVVAAALASAPCSLADGDPASDYLLTQSTFLSPLDGHVPQPAATRLIELLAQMKASGFTLKVAVITSRYDMGADPELFRKAQTYARFLATEDFYVWKGELLIVMPNGYGLYRTSANIRGPNTAPAEDLSLVTKLPPLDTTDGPELVAAATRAVAALAERRGITVVTPDASTHSSSAWLVWTEIAGATAAIVLFMVGLRVRRRGAGGGS
ncbi:MAG TPA: hypothetical protein VGM80_00605 [Gaiellaceae bacterium]